MLASLAAAEVLVDDTLPFDGFIEDVAAPAGVGGAGRLVAGAAARHVHTGLLVGVLMLGFPGDPLIQIGWLGVVAADNVGANAAFSMVHRSLRSSPTAP